MCIIYVRRGLNISCNNLCPILLLNSSQLNIITLHSKHKYSKDTDNVVTGTKLRKYLKVTDIVITGTTCVNIYMSRIL